MALVQCPECGQTISNAAKHCVHCGVDLIVCPECKSILKDEEKLCLFCGYSLKEEPKTANPTTAKPVFDQSIRPTVATKNQQQQSDATVKSLYDDWAKVKKVPDVLLQRWISWIFIGITLLFSIIALKKFFSLLTTLGDLSDLEKFFAILTVEDALTDIKPYFIIAIIFALIYPIILSAQELYIHLSISNWLKTCNVDYKPVIARALSTKSDLYIGKAEYFSSAAWLKDNPNKKPYRIVTCALSIFFTLAATIVASLVLFNIIEQSVLYTLNLADSLQFGKTILVLIIAIAPTIICNILESMCKKTGKAWLKLYYKSQTMNK